MSEENELSGHAEEEVVKKNQIAQEKGLGYVLNVDKQDLFKAASGLKEAGFDLFLFVSGIDYPDSIKLTYRVYSTKTRNKFGVMIKTEVPKSNPVIDSLVPLWSAADWHERETYDLYGVQFTGHPDLRRIFMPEDWVGYPLRKDYSDDHMIVMDDGKKEKAATTAGEKEKPAVKEPKADDSEVPKDK
jgi:NADH/F420H2 dehydrogenase subunit C